MGIATMYAEGRARMLELAAELDGADAAKPVPACPGWTVKDVYAHVAGVAADILAGQLEGVATDPWTARQVAARKDRSLAEVAAEWTASSEQLDAGLAALGDAVDPRLIIDIWTHEQDVRGAVQRPGARDNDAAAFAAATALTGIATWWDETQRPAFAVKTETIDEVVGAGAPAATLRTTNFELARLLLGRRTPVQVAALDWDGDPSSYADVLHIFGPAGVPVVE